MAFQLSLLTPDSAFHLTPAFLNHVGFPQAWQNIIIASVFTALGFIFYVLALYRLDVSVLGPLFQFRTAFAVLFSAFLLGEKLASHQYLLIGIIFLAGMFVSIDEKMTWKSFFQKPIAVGLLDMVALALMGVFLKKALAENSYWEVTLWSGMLTQLILLVTGPLFFRDFIRLSKNQVVAISGAALVSFIGGLASIKAYAENVSISAAIISLPFSMIVALVLAIFVPNLFEKYSRKVYGIRFSAATVMFLAALKLSA